MPYDAVDVALVETARDEAQHEAETVVREQVLTKERRDDSVPNHTTTRACVPAGWSAVACPSATR